MFVENQISQDGKERNTKTLLFFVFVLLFILTTQTLKTETAESPPKLTASTLTPWSGQG